MTPSRPDRILRRLGRALTHSRVLRRLVPRPTNARGDVLDPSLAVMLALEQRVLGGVLDPDPSVPRKRADMIRSSWLAAGDPPGIAVQGGVLARGRDPGGTAYRAYGPPDARGGLVFFHGGGWVVGGLGTHDVLCRRLALGSGRRVLSVAYPLAPEVRFPAMVHHCADAWQDARDVLIAGGVPADRIALGGDSAGGNLTASVCRLMRDGGGPAPELQLLIYPGVDATRSCASHRELGEGFVLTSASIDWYLRQYAPVPEHPLASPVLAPDLEGLAPAIVTVAGFDPLRDEGLWYADRLRDAGVPVTLLDERALVHGYANMDGLIPEASAAIERIARALRV